MLLVFERIIALLGWAVLATFGAVWYSAMPTPELKCRCCFYPPIFFFYYRYYGLKLLSPPAPYLSSLLTVLGYASLGGYCTLPVALFLFCCCYADDNDGGG